MKNKRKSQFLYSAEIYCDAVKIFLEELESLSIKSEGFRKFRDYLKEYYSGDRFKTLSKEIKIIKEFLANIKYQIIIQDNSFTVQNYEEGIDYSKEIEKILRNLKLEL